MRRISEPKLRIHLLTLPEGIMISDVKTQQTGMIRMPALPSDRFDYQAIFPGVTNTIHVTVVLIKGIYFEFNSKPELVDTVRTGIVTSLP